MIDLSFMYAARSRASPVTVLPLVQCSAYSLLPETIEQNRVRVRRFDHSSTIHTACLVPSVMPTQRRRTLGCATPPSRSSGACVLAALLSALPHALCQTDSSEPPPGPPPGHRQAPRLPPFPPPPPAPPAPLGPPPLPDATSGETLDVKSIYYIYAAVISGFALILVREARRARAAGGVRRCGDRAARRSCLRLLACGCLQRALSPPARATWRGARGAAAVLRGLHTQQRVLRTARSALRYVRALPWLTRLTPARSSSTASGPPPSSCAR